MAIYGNTISFGGGGQNDTLPPLLDNFRANKGKHETVDFLSVPAGSTILLGKYKGKPIRWKVIDGFANKAGERGNNYLRIYDRNLISPRAYYEGYNYQESLPNDGSREDFTKTTLCKWLNSPDKKSPYYGNESGFLYEWTAEERNVLINWWRNTGWAINVGITVEVPEGAHIGFPHPTDPNNTFWRGLNFEKKAATTVVYTYETLSSGTLSPKAPEKEAEYLVSNPLSVEPEISIDSLTQFVFNGTDYVLESAMETQPIVISADKVEESRATDLAGAVWVYGDHIPQNKNDGTKIELARDEVINPDAAQTFATGKTIADLPSKTKVKLGKFNGIPLKWLVCRDSVDQSLRLILDAESVGVIGNKMFDNHEPNNPDSNRKNYGNNRYIWSNIRQWLNSDKPANQWYTAQHTYDAPPNYTNVAGFLHEWTEKEIGVLENASWVVTKHSVDGGGAESFQSGVVLPSTTEMGLESNTGGTRIDIFNNNEDRVVSGIQYWCRTPYSSNAYDTCTIHTGGTLYHYRTDNTGFGVRPLCKPVASNLVSDTPDSDGCYTFIFTPPLERTVVWDKSKNFYARQFTYNSKKQYQTMLEGAIAYLPIMPDGQELSKLPSKSKVKLGRYGDADLQWLVSRNAENKLILVLDSNSISALGNKMLDAAEPNNSNSNRRDYGNNRYIYTNLHQWLNAEKGANQWFVKAHNADTPPDYQNQAGFLNGWKKEELDLLELAEWTVTKTGVDGGGTETFQSKVVLPSTTEMGFSTEGGGSKLDIFNSDSDRQTGSTYWTRTPFPTSSCINYQVKSDGTQYSGGYNSYDGAIRPICSIPETTLVSIEADIEGCYTLV